MSFWFLWIPMLRVHGHYKYVYLLSAGILRIWRLKHTSATSDATTDVKIAWLSTHERENRRASKMLQFWNCIALPIALAYAVALVCFGIDQIVCSLNQRDVSPDSCPEKSKKQRIFFIWGRCVCGSIQILTSKFTLEISSHPIRKLCCYYIVLNLSVIQNY